MLRLKLKLFTLNCIKNELSKNKISVISLMTFYDNRNSLMYKFIGAVIYTIIYEYIHHDYMGLLQEKLSKHDNNFKIPSSAIFLGW